MQRTLRHDIHCAGVGLHSGERVKMTLYPAPIDSGITVAWSDGPYKGQSLKASWQHAVETPLCTTLIAGEQKVSTVEHLFSALAGCGIDNARIELTGTEIPIMDGSAAPFVYLIDCAGTVEQDVPRRVLKILKPIVIEDGDRIASLEPGDGFSVSFEIDFDGTTIGHQQLALDMDETTYRREIARARTFGFFEQVELMRRNGLALGGSLDNAVVFKNGEVLNPGGLRFHNEPVRHKILDSIGDLYLAGGAIEGHYRGVRCGHALNCRLLKTLFADERAWCWIDAGSTQARPQAAGAVLPESAVAAFA